jgi:uncharacterized protein YbjT (DUF2867 family)
MAGGQPPLAAVTGGTGFLGRHVVQALAGTGGGCGSWSALLRAAAAGREPRRPRWCAAT